MKKTKVKFLMSFVFLLSVAFFACGKEQKTEKKALDKNSTQKEKTIEYRYVNASSGLKIRKTPGGEKVGSLKANEEVEFISVYGKEEEIDGVKADWIRIRTKDGIEGYVFGAYLSESLKAAQQVQDNEKRKYCSNCLDKGNDWMRQFELTMEGEGISIFENPYFIKYSEDGAAMTRDYGADGITFVLEYCYDDENDQSGWFLHSAVVYDNGKDFPDFLPFKIGDDYQKVTDLFGDIRRNEPDSYARFEEGYYNNAWDFYVRVDAAEDNTVNRIILRKTGW